MNDELLREAAERWGTPLYVTDLDAAAVGAYAWREALPGALVAYAVKANLRSAGRPLSSIGAHIGSDIGELGAFVRLAGAGWLLTRVVRVQPRGHLVADAGMTELIRPMLYGARHPVHLLDA